MKITVFAYPLCSKRLDQTIGAMNELLRSLESQYAIILDVEIRNGVDVMLPVAELLDEFLGSCSRVHGWLDVKWLSYLNWVVYQPTDQTVSAIDSISDCVFLGPFLTKAKV